MPRRKGYRRPPVWPDLVNCLSAADFEQMKREFDEFKDARRLPRVTRFSAEDFATIWVSRVIADGRSTLLKRAG